MQRPGGHTSIFTLAVRNAANGTRTPETPFALRTRGRAREGIRYGHVRGRRQSQALIGHLLVIKKRSFGTVQRVLVSLDIAAHALLHGGAEIGECLCVTGSGGAWRRLVKRLLYCGIQA